MDAGAVSRPELRVRAELQAGGDGAAAERFILAGSAGRALAEVTGGMPAAEFAPWCLAANVILNLDEFVMRE